MALPRTKLIFIGSLQKAGGGDRTVEMAKKLINTSPCKVWQGTHCSRVYVDHRSNNESNGLSLRGTNSNNLQEDIGPFILYMLNMLLFRNLKDSASV